MKRIRKSFQEDGRKPYFNRKDRTISPFNAARQQLANYFAPVLWAILLLAGRAQAATTTTAAADYQFDNTLASSVSGAPALLDLGGNSFGPIVVDGIGRTGLSFAQNDGLSYPLPNVVPNDHSTIVVLFQFSDTLGWRRILDFKNRTSDDGLYNYNGRLNFYDTALSSDAPIAAGAWVQVALTRDVAQNVVGYVNGIQEISFVDTNGLAIMDSANPLQFFQDDLVFTNEASAGAVARIRLYAEALTAGQVAALDRLPGETSSVIQFSSDSFAYPENPGPVALTLTRVGQTSEPASVQWQVVGGTATPGLDYVETSGAVNFAPGQTSQNLYLTLLDDGLVEPDKTVFLGLTNAVGATLGGPSIAMLTILEKDTNTPAIADLQVTKFADQYNVDVGALVTFTIMVNNNGPALVTNVVVPESLDPGWGLVSVFNGPNASFDVVNQQWTIFNLPPYTSEVLTLQAQALVAGLLSNRVDVVPPPGLIDPNPANNRSSIAVSVAAQATQADLMITKSASTNNVRMGEQVVFTLILQNLGPGNITNPVVTTDCLPLGFQYLTDSTYGNATNGSYSPGTCWWTLPDGINAGQSFTLQITVLATNAGLFTNVASVAVPAGVTDPNLANNTASAVVAVAALKADLAVGKTVTPAALPINSSTPPFNFRLTITNLGPDTVSNVTLTDVLPPGLSFSGSINGPDSSFEPTNGTWTILNLLAPGQGSAMTLAAVGTNAGVFTNTVTVNIPVGVTDTNLSNNSASAVVNVLPVYSLSGYADNCRSNGTPLANLTVTLSGAANQVTTTIPGGFYKFTGLSNGVYTVTPSQPGNQFVPPSQTITISNANVTLPTFVGSVGLIYGGLFYFGSPITNHPVRLSGAQSRTVFTDTNGYYLFTNTPAGNYTVAPVATNGYTFTPTNAAISLNAANCAGLANFFAQARALQLVALEVVQVIQDWSNSVVLIQDKETWVRAHLQLTNPANPVLVQGARLYGSGPGGALPGSPLSPANNAGALLVRMTNAAAGRGQFTNSLNFRLPPSWLSGQISLRFVATNNLTVVPTNTVPANSTVQVSFVPSRPLPLVIYPVNWRRAADGNLQRSSANNLADLPRRILSMYPVPSVNSTLAQPLVAPFTAQPVQADYTALNRQISGIRDFVRFFVTDNRIYHGAVARGGPGWPATGEAHLPGFVSSALMPNDADFYSDRFLRHLASHEIGHNLGRPHDINDATALTGPCGEQADPGTPVYPFAQRVPSPAGPVRPALGPMTNGVNALVYGLDTLTRANAPRHNPVADPNLDFDVMGYCDHAPLQWWISASTYPAMLRYITNTFAPPAPPPPPGPLRRWLFMRGPIDFAADTGSFLPFYTMDTTSGYIPPPPPPGNYSLRLFDSAGNQLDEILFTPEGDADETLGTLAAPAATGSFDIPVDVGAYSAAIDRVELWEGGATLLARQVAGASRPQFNGDLGVTQTANSVHLSWNMQNAAASAIQYSADGGTTWTTLALDWPSQSYDTDPEYLEATTNGLFRIIATDGFSSSDQTNSLPVKISPHPPRLILNSPLDGSLFVGDQQIFLDASATDMQDGALGDANVQWTSSRDGLLGYGKIFSFEAELLSEGSHLLTITATNSLGLSSSAFVQITVVRQTPPELTISISANQVLLTWPAGFTSYVLESTTDLGSGIWTPISEAPVAADAQQTVALDATSLSKFFRLRMP